METKWKFKSSVECSSIIAAAAAGCGYWPVEEWEMGDGREHNGCNNDNNSNRRAAKRENWKLGRRSQQPEQPESWVPMWRELLSFMLYTWILLIRVYCLLLPILSVSDCSVLDCSLTIDNRPSPNFCFFKARQSSLRQERTLFPVLVLMYNIGSMVFEIVDTAQRGYGTANLIITMVLSI